MVNRQKYYRVCEPSRNRRNWRKLKARPVTSCEAEREYHGRKVCENAFNTCVFDLESIFFLIFVKSINVGAQGETKSAKTQYFRGALDSPLRGTVHVPSVEQGQRGPRCVIYMIFENQIGK